MIEEKQGYYLVTERKERVCFAFNSFQSNSIMIVLGIAIVFYFFAAVWDFPEAAWSFLE